MKCQILFSRKNKKNIISLSSAEFARSMVSVSAVCGCNTFPYTSLQYSSLLRFSDPFLVKKCVQYWFTP